MKLSRNTRGISIILRSADVASGCTPYECWENEPFSTRSFQGHHGRRNEQTEPDRV